MACGVTSALTGVGLVFPEKVFTEIYLQVTKILLGSWLVVYSSGFLKYEHCLKKFTVTIWLNYLLVGGVLSGVDVPVVEMVHEEGAHYPSIRSLSLIHMSVFIGTGTAFSRLVRWSIGIQRIWKCKSGFCAGGFLSFILFYQFIAAGILGNMQGKLGIPAWRW